MNCLKILGLAALLSGGLISIAFAQTASEAGPPVTTSAVPQQAAPPPTGDLPRGMTQAEALARLSPGQKLTLQTDQAPLIAYFKALPVRWQKFPGPDALERYIPKSARQAKVRGVVLAQCDWDAQGVVTDCHILEENPVGYGYGAATTALLKANGTVALKPGQNGELASGVGLPVILRWEWAY